MPDAANNRDELLQLHRLVETRTRAISKQRPQWPCRSGCDTCCRSLANVPVLSEAEWELLSEGLRALSSRVRSEVEQRVTSMRGRPPSRPLVCPLLAPDSGTCLVYDHRPVACRTYGFYVERDKGLYCSEIEGRGGGEYDDVVWGNQAAIDVRLKRLGPGRDLTSWITRTAPPSPGTIQD